MFEHDLTRRSKDTFRCSFSAKCCSLQCQVTTLIYHISNHLQSHHQHNRYYQDGYTTEISGPEAVPVLVAVRAKPNSHNSSSLNREFFKSFLDVSWSIILPVIFPHTKAKFAEHFSKHFICRITFSTYDFLLQFSDPSVNYLRCC